MQAWHDYAPGFVTIPRPSVCPLSRNAPSTLLFLRSTITVPFRRLCADRAASQAHRAPSRRVRSARRRDFYAERCLQRCTFACLHVCGNMPNVFSMYMCSSATRCLSRCQHIDACVLGDKWEALSMVCMRCMMITISVRKFVPFFMKHAKRVLITF